MKMISATQVRANFLQLFRLMRDTGMYVEFHNMGQVYRLSIEDMKVRTRFRINKRSYTQAIESGKCLTCGKLTLSDVCMNVNCPSVK